MSDHVFAIDDDPSMLRLITVVLKTEGFRVAPFDSAVAALLEIADPSEPNPLAVILDLNMPEMDGREFYNQAQSGRPNESGLNSLGLWRRGGPARTRGRGGDVQAIRWRRVREHGQETSNEWSKLGKWICEAEKQR